MFTFAGWISWQSYANDFLRTLKVLLPVETDATSRCIKFQNSNIVNFYSMLSEYTPRFHRIFIVNYAWQWYTWSFIVSSRFISFHLYSSAILYVHILDVMSRKKHEGESKDTKRTDNAFAINCILSKKFGIDELQHHFFETSIFMVNQNSNEYYFTFSTYFCM